MTFENTFSLKSLPKPAPTLEAKNPTVTEAAVPSKASPSILAPANKV